MLRAFEALVAGLAVLLACSFAIERLLRHFVPDWFEPTRPLRWDFVLSHLGTSFLTTAAGGFVTAWVAQENALVYVLVLAIAVLVLAGLSALHGRSRLPVAYQLATVAIAPFGVLVGGLVRLRVSGVLP